MFCKEMSCKFIFKIVFQLYDVNMMYWLKASLTVVSIFLVENFNEIH